KPSQPLAGEIVVVETVVNGVGGKLGHLERQQHAGGIDRIEKPVGVADQNKPVAGALSRAVGVVDDRINLVHARAARDSPPARFAFLDLLIKDLGKILAAPFDQVTWIGDYAHARNIVLEWNVPEPAAAAPLGPQYEGRTAVQVRFAHGSLEVGIEHSLLELGIPHAH